MINAKSNANGIKGCDTKQYYIAKTGIPFIQKSHLGKYNRSKVVSILAFTHSKPFLYARMMEMHIKKRKSAIYINKFKDDPAAIDKLKSM